MNPEAILYPGETLLLLMLAVGVFALAALVWWIGRTVK